MSDKKKIDFSELKVIPNILTIIRILLICPLVHFFALENFKLVLIIVAISGLTDFLDGFLARKLDMITDLGKILDPLADKMTLISVAICLYLIFPVILPFMIILLIKDTLMLAGSTLLIKKGIKPPASKWYGKLGTIIFYLSVSVLFFSKAVLNYQNDYLSVILMVVTSCTMIFALFKYFKLFLVLNKSS